MAGALDHDLDAVLPGELGGLAQGLELGELGAVVGVGDRARPQAVAERERHVVFAHDVANLVEALVEEALFVTGEAPLRHYGTTSRNNPGDAVGGEMDVAE